MEDRFADLERKVEEHEARLRDHGQELARLRTALRDIERLARELEDEGG